MSLADKVDWTEPTPSSFVAAEANRDPNLSYTDAMVRLYASRARQHARAEDLGADGWYAEVVLLEGVWGEGDTREEAEADLEVAIVAWLEIKLANGDRIPEMDGIEF